MELSHEPPITEQVVLTHPAERPRWKRILITGLVILVPSVLTVQVLWRLFLFMDGIFAPVIDQTFALFLERDVHIPGLGLLLTFLVISGGVLLPGLYDEALKRPSEEDEE